MRRTIPLIVLLAGAIALGAIGISAAVTQSGSSGGSQGQVSARIKPTDLRVLVPAYFYPISGSPWSRLNVAATAHPGRVAAIGNPFNGPGATLDPTYQATFEAFRASGGTLLGYVFTSHGARPQSEVQADIDAWLQFYELDGIFFDEMSNTAGQDEAYYLALGNYVGARIPNALIVGNPGTSTSPGYLYLDTERVVSTLCIFEDGVGFLSWNSDPWVQRYGGQHFYALPHSTPSSQWQAVVDHAYAQNCGWVYVTDDILPNPWDTLPAFFEALVAYVDTTY